MKTDLQFPSGVIDQELRKILNKGFRFWKAVSLIGYLTKWTRRK